MAATAVTAGRSARSSTWWRAFRALSEKLLEASAVLVLLASLVFFALRLLPGDPARLVLGEQASDREVTALRHSLGLDVPLWRQYATFLRGLPTLDVGDSLRRPGIAARARVFEALGPTAELAGLAVMLGATIGVLFALLHHGPWLGRRAPLVGRVATFVAAVPLLAMAPALTFAVCVRARLVPLPGDPEAGFAGLLFAAGLLAIPLSAHTARVGIAAIDEVKSMPFLRVAAAKGAAPFRVWCLHALAASAGPVIVVVAAQLGALLGGAVVLERLFERPGLGTLILEAYGGRDLPVLEASVVAAGALFVVAQAASGMLHALFDPRVRG